MADRRRVKRREGRWRHGGVAAIVALSLLGVAPASAHAAFQLGLMDPDFQSPAASPESQAGYAALAAIHGSTVRITVKWEDIAPGGSTRPAGFNAADPADPLYHWSTADTAVAAAAAHHARVLLQVQGAPAWAQPAGEPRALRAYAGPWDPSSTDFAAFMRAAGVRYSGSYPDPLHPGSFLPRVQDWEIYNEENLPASLNAPNPVAEYRSLLNAAYGALKSVHGDNVVVVGGLGPVSVTRSIPALTFAAELMCLRHVGTSFLRTAACPQRAEFDVLGMHPYTLGATPTLHALDPGDVLVADMGELHRLVRTAETLHTIGPRISHQVWVTEWAWPTNPPDRFVGDSYAITARYVAYSMYEMWASGVSLVVWDSIEDQPPAVAEVNPVISGGGLVASSGQPKPSFQAFSFPVIASVSRGRGLVWGRAPVSGPARVVIERSNQGAWQPLATVPTASDGVFDYHFAASTNGIYRAAVVAGPTSLAYNSTPIPAKRTPISL